VEESSLSIVLSMPVNSFQCALLIKCLPKRGLHPDYFRRTRVIAGGQRRASTTWLESSGELGALIWSQRRKEQNQPIAMQTRDFTLQGSVFWREPVCDLLCI
jgi:hypothetical protein